MQCRYNPYKYSKQAVAGALDDSTADTETGQQSDPAQPAQQQSPLGPRGDAATIWHANEAAELDDDDAEPGAAERPPAAPEDGAVDQLQGAAEDTDWQQDAAEDADWQQVATAVCSDDAVPTTAAGGGGGGRAAVYRDSDGTTCEDTQEDAFSADASGAGHTAATIWHAPESSGPQTTMTEPLGEDADVLGEAEAVAAAARQYRPSAADAAPEQQSRATADDAALPLQVHFCVPRCTLPVRTMHIDCSTARSKQA